MYRRALLILGLVLAAVGAQAAAFPEKPVHIVVAYPTGSTMDALARLLAAEVQASSGGVYIVDNKPGAAGRVGAEFVAKAKPDGYTLFIAGSSTHSANPALFKQLPYDPVKDFAPIIKIATLSYALVVAADSPVKNVDELVKYARAKPNGLSYGYGSQLAQVASAAIAKMTAMKTLGVPYKGQPPLLTDLIGHQVDFGVADVPVLLPLIQSGKLRPLAVLSTVQSPLLPNVPTLAQQGFAGYDLLGWIGLEASGGTPPAVVKTLADAWAQVLGKPEMRTRLASMGMDYEPNTPAEFGRMVSEQLSVWAKRIQDAGIHEE